MTNSLFIVPQLFLGEETTHANLTHHGKQKSHIEW